MSDRVYDHSEPCSTYPSSNNDNGRIEMDQPSLNLSTNKPFNINIEPLDYGFRVVVGCQTFAIEKKETLIKGLEAYLKDPRGIQDAWFTGKFKP